MSWRLFLTTFATILLAEIGDKTQIAAMSLVASGGSKWAVMVGSICALAVATVISVLAGEVIGRAISGIWLRRGAGVLWVAMGVLLLLGREMVFQSR